MDAFFFGESSRVVIMFLYESFRLPVLAGAAGAYCSPYIAVDGSDHARPSGQSLSGGASRLVACLILILLILLLNPALFIISCLFCFCWLVFLIHVSED